MRGSYVGWIARQVINEHINKQKQMGINFTFEEKVSLARAKTKLRERTLRIQKDGVQAALAEEAAELKRARIMNRCEPGYERKDGKL